MVDKKKIKRAIRDNPDLPPEFVQDILEALEEDDLTPYEWGENND